MRRSGLFVTMVLAASCAHAAPPEVIQRDAAHVLRAKAKLVASPSASTVAAAVEAKALLVHDLCCYESADAGSDAWADR